MLKIALIEDKPEEMERAQQAMVQIMADQDMAKFMSVAHVDIEYESFDMSLVSRSFVIERLEEMRSAGTLSGVITDLHFNPAADEKPYPNDTPIRVERLSKFRENPPPAGLMIALWCVARGIPVVICTDGHHHGAETAWVFGGWGFPRDIDYRVEADDKNWVKAGRTLLSLIKKSGKK